MKKIIAATAVAAALALAGCSAGTQAVSSESSSPAASQTAAPAATPKATPSSTPSHGALTVKFGETIKYEDGMKLTISLVGSGVASTTAAPSQARGAEVQIFQITLENTSAQPFDPALFYETAVFGKNGAKAEKVFDSANGWGAANFSGLIVPGGKQTVEAAWLIPTADVSTTIFTVQPSFKHAKSIIMGGL